MKEAFALIDQFFFSRISASGFGLMRIAWGISTLAYLITHFEDATFYFSDAGILPNALGGLVFRKEYRFTILQFVTDPSAVMLLYVLYMLVVACVICGLRTRISMLTAIILMFSFHERNLLYLGGGETTLRNFGYILAISPGIEAFSLDRAMGHFGVWKKDRTLLPPMTISIWPLRLLLWQFLVIYLTSLWDKLLGNMWVSGNAVASALHHAHFARWPMVVYDILAPLSPIFAWYTLMYEASWALLLLPQDLLQERFPILRRHSIKRWILFNGVLFHGAIYILMDVGSFSLAMGTGYLGLLVKEDFDVFRSFFNRRFRGRIAVLYDGACRLCQRSVFVLILCDHLRRLRCIDFRDASLRKDVAPDVTLTNLDRAMHIKVSGRYEKGFDAFRVLSRHLPPLWPLLPFLYLPGMTGLGRSVYARVAANRNRCAGGACKHR